MFRIILKRQSIEDLLTWRFLTSLVLIIFAVAGFSLVFAGRYSGLREEYAKAVAQNDRNLREFAKSPSEKLRYSGQSLVLCPRPELFIAEGGELDLPRGFVYRPWQHKLLLLSQQEETAGVQVYRSISKKRRLSDVLTYSSDLTFIVQLILSFFALILSYDTVTAEKEKGTLGLIFSNPARRGDLIFAKYLSALITMGLALLVSLIMSLVFLNVLSAVPLTLSLMTSVLLFLLFALVYLSIFILIGMICSSSSSSSKNSLVLCLLVWVIVVILIPKATGMVLAAKRYDVPTAEEISRMAEKARFDAGSRLEEQLPAEYRANWQKYRLSEKVLRSYDEADRAQQDVLDTYLRKKLAAVAEVERINFFSPASLFERAAASVSGTGIPHFESLWTLARRYVIDFENFVGNNRSVLGKGAFFYLESETVSNEELEFNALPNFEDQTPTAAGRFEDAWPYLGLMLLYNLFLFIFVIYKFQRYDIR